MKNISGIKKILTVILICFGITAFIFANGCVESKKVAAKSGAQLWAENCQRCHNTPSPGAFASEQWKTLGMHMQTRAQLTNNERDKIVEFMQSMNR
jgi:mono/diheme cytochrome c family protein